MSSTARVQGTRPSMRIGRARPMPQEAAQTLSGLGTYAFLGSLLVCAGLGVWLGGFRELWPSLKGFVTGQPLGLTVAQPLQVVSIFSAAIVFVVAGQLLASAVVRVLKGPAKIDTFSTVFDLGDGHYFRAIFLTVLAEELFARWLMLGVIHHFWTGMVALYVLFFVGNTIWAAVHYWNNDESERSLWRALPLFVTGIVFTVVYLQYGFMAALLTHFAFDAVVLARYKRQKSDASNAAYGIYYVLAGIVSYLVLTDVYHARLSQTSAWFHSNSTFAIPGWGVGQYLCVSVFVAAVVAVVLEVLALDWDNIALLRKTEQRDQGIISRTIFGFLGSMLYMLVVLGAYHLLGLVMHDPWHRIITLALTAAVALCTSNSGSGVSRTFWETITSLFVLLVSLVALGFWGGVTFLLIKSTIDVIPTSIVRNADR